MEHQIVAIFVITKPQHDAEDLLVNQPPGVWNQILEELKQLYTLQTEENRAMQFAG